MHRPFLVLLAVLILHFACSASRCLADTTWQGIGPFGGGALTLAVDPINSQNLFAGTSAGVYKSSNGGASWTAASSGMPVNTSVSIIAIDPTNSLTVYAGTAYGVFKSSDGGSSWVAANSGITNIMGLQVASLALDPANHKTLYAVTGDGIFKSTDGGASWLAVNNGLATTEGVNFIAIDPTNSRTLYAGSLGTAYKSTDAGASWTAANSGFTTDAYGQIKIYSLTVDPTNSQTVYAATGTGVFKSVNGGSSWAPVYNPPRTAVFSLALDPGNSQVIYAAATNTTTSAWTSSMIKSTDGGASWAAENPDVGFFVFDPSNSKTLYAEGANGILKSVDGGASWAAANNGWAISGVVEALAIDPANDQTIFAGTNYDLYKSANGGASWSKADSGLTSTNVFKVVIDPRNDQTVFAATNGGVFKSSDGGASWTISLKKNSVCSLTIDPSNSQTIYAGTWLNDLFKSTDGGASWTDISSAFGSVNAIAVDPSNSHVLYIGTGYVFTHLVGGGVYKSTDGGATWTAYYNGMPTMVVTSLAIDPTNSQTVYAGGAGGIYKSVNGGAAWTLLGSGLPAMAIAIDPTSSQVLYASGSQLQYDTISGSYKNSGCVFKSTNGGASWQAAYSGMTTSAVNSFAIDPNNSQLLYAGTSNGVFKTVTPGAPLISIPVGTSFSIGTPGSLKVSASGWPVPTLSVSGALPNGLTFDPVTGILGGTPLLGSAGSYPIIFSASTGVPPDAARGVTVTVLPASVLNVAISAPAGSPPLASLAAITGSAGGSGLSRVDLQVTDGTFYLQGDGSFGTAPPSPWLGASGTTTWSFNSSSVPWVEGVSYTVTARASSSAATAMTSTSFSIQQKATKQAVILSAAFTPAAIKAGDSAAIGGTLVNGVTAALAGKTVKIIITPPSSAAVPNPAPVVGSYSTDSGGNFSSGPLSFFPTPGVYAVQVRFEGDATCQAALQSFSLPVVAQSGYAIIVVGKAADNSLLDLHTASATSIYNTLIRKRGFLDSNIIPLISTTNAAVSKQQIQSAITQIKAKYAAAPAPFYLFLIDHGSPTGFMLGDSTPALTLTPAELGSWLDDFESGADGAALASFHRFLVVGTCYSGLFQSLSKPGRVIVTSSAADEQSLAGATAYNSTSTVLSGGDYFVDSFVSFLGRGDSFNDAYDQAASAVALRDPRSGTLPLAYHSGAVDTLAQHPLLDDNGDGSASYGPAGGGDGALASSLYLGEGVRVPAAGNPSDITAVTPTALAPISILGTTASTTTLWLSVNDNSRVGKAWVEVRTPDTTVAAGSTGQVIPSNLDSLPLIYDGARWVGDYGKFSKAGRYDIYYYTSDNQTGDISPMAHSAVYKLLAGNSPPGNFTLGTPNDGAAVSASFPLSWQEVADPRGLSYSLLVSTDSNFGSMVYRQDDIPQGATSLPQGALKDPASATGGYYCQKLGSYCYWKVQAIDSFGAITESPVRKFSIVETNGLLGLIKGYLRNSSGAPLAGATVTVGNSSITTLGNGFFLTQVPSGSYPVTAAASGYSQQVRSVTVSAANVASADFMLSAPVAKPGDCDGNGTVSIAEVQGAIDMFLGLKPVLACVDLDNSGVVTISEVQKVVNSFLGL
jgi:photosystem II stability/assembly factor-like uncharacterized protein